ncbi:uncharacterized protein B0I36DRAFT_436131 [Microdochium trichocladiopsis]|uniref:NmrA-like domain-containing protein n=1 Tax=Microdochium trichocladiopsis TaxID=1682393 RepID=A0A9P8XVL2_9PEZI|nr:uncharacterized protein B0I36DRAFT_436131 [Microdochium trichocladiopsis]KAH7016467.1 hypothetical protein B0I36DRAFT_436131 [Microdochium trichocladiopsis]
MASTTQKFTVFIAGASGETGSSIPQQFDVVALARPESVNNKFYTSISEQGVKVIPVNVRDVDALVKIISGGGDTPASSAIVISCMTLTELPGELALVEASRRARVGRHVPSFFATVCPPRGVMDVRTAKEDVLDTIKRAYMPYTAIDIGWWAQWCLPRLPSGKLDSALAFPVYEIVGAGDVPCAFTDVTDVGAYVVRIISDPRTINRLVFAYGDVRTQTEIWDMFERLSGEKIPRPVLSPKGVEEVIANGREKFAKDPTNYGPLADKGMAEYKYSYAVRGDNTPEHAKYLGYLDATELYPDVKIKTVEDYAREVLDGKNLGVVYAGKDNHPMKYMSVPKYE